jgi:RNA polymerase sigma-70 factor, ECF subfamily
VSHKSFEQIYRAQFAFVWRTLRLLGVPPESLEDAAQDTFSIVARQLASFEGRSALSTWIFAIAQRVAANHRRTRRRKLAPLRPLRGSFAGNEPTPQAAAEAAEATARIESFAAQLDDEHRTLFILALIEGVSAVEVAALQGLSVNTVYSRIRALREDLKRFLALSELGSARDMKACREVGGG